MLGSGEIINRRFLANPARLACLVAARVLRPLVELDEAPEEIAPLAQRHSVMALESLVKQVRDGTSEASCVAAANVILDRGWGKPVVDVGGTGFLPFLGRAPDRNANLELIARARRAAPMAVEKLRLIASEGQVESARVAAARSLIDRGLGIAAPAKIDFDTPRLGKREQAILAANAIASEESGWGDDLQPRLH